MSSALHVQLEAAADLEGIKPPARELQRCFCAMTLDVASRSTPNNTTPQTPTPVHGVTQQPVRISCELWCQRLLLHCLPLLVLISKTFGEFWAVERDVGAHHVVHVPPQRVKLAPLLRRAKEAVVGAAPALQIRLNQPKSGAKQSHTRARAPACLSSTARPPRPSPPETPS